MSFKIRNLFFILVLRKETIYVRKNINIHIIHIFICQRKTKMRKLQNDG